MNHTAGYDLDLALEPAPALATAADRHEPEDYDPFTCWEAVCPPEAALLAQLGQ